MSDLPRLPDQYRDYKNISKLFSLTENVRARPYWFKAPLLVAERCVCGHYYSVNEWYPDDGSVKEHKCPLDLRNWVKSNNINLHQTGRDYWKNVFDRIRDEGVYFAGVLNKYVKDLTFIDPVFVLQQWRYEEREDAKVPRPQNHKYGERLDKWISRELQIAIERISDPCTDNLRWAEMSNKGEMRHYYRWQRQGCCGSYDAEITDPETGRKFMIGFNYGH